MRITQYPFGLTVKNKGGFIMLISVLISIGYIILIVCLSVTMNSSKLRKNRKKIKQLDRMKGL